MLSAPDKRLHKRVYFYVNEGNGVTPESDVGSHAHRVTLNNLYELDRDVLDLNTADANVFESAVLDHGFDVIGPLLGVTFSKGAPGGPAVGEMYAQNKKHQMTLLQTMPEVRRLLKYDEEDKAIELMHSIGLSTGEIRAILGHQEEPESRLSARAMRKFKRQADDESFARMERFIDNR